jgi:hypothetical protein
MFALVALAWAGVRAQGTGSVRNAPDTRITAEAQAAQAKPAANAQAKPAEPTQEELPPDFKAFNDAAKEKDAQKRVQAYEKFIADYPKSMLVSMARSQIQSSVLASLKDARKKYLEMVKAQVDAAKAGENTMNLYSTYNRIASDMLNGGVLLEEAEEYARTGLSLMDERSYVEARKQAAERSAEAFAKRAAAPATTATQRAVSGISISTVNGVMVAKPVMRSPTPPSTTPPSPPRMPTDEELRASFRSQRASAQATFGQILLKRGKTTEGERVLKEAYAARLASYTLATIAKVLAESAKKAGDETGQLEYLATLALSGRITSEEQKDFEAVYRKTHNGSLDGLEEMLDERYRRANPRFEVKPATRTPAPNARAVLAELFSGAG